MSQPIFDRLKALRGLPALKQLLYEDLGYPRANQILSTRDWPTALTEKLHTHPLIVAEAGAFKLIYLHFRGALERGPQRGIIDQLLVQYPTSLFIFSDKEQTHWHFVQVKHEGIGNRSVLRRMAVDYGNDHRTVAERLALLDYSALEQDLFGVSALALQAALTKAFDVEAVSKKFFEDYRRLFEAVEQAVPVLAAEPRRLFVQKLFNRLMFLMFVERKGWLHFNGRSDYLRALWEDYQRSAAQGSATTFYADRLQTLFFHGLNRMPNAPDTLSDHDRERLIGQVPYLNGGLFEHDDDDTNPLITIPDTVFGRIIHELFYRYNWTVTESTPLDVEVAVDPEMLGRVFEELVTGRHESGSYYTPKPIVAFMCREGLKGYLQSQVSDESAAAIEAFVDEHTADDITNPEAILNALQLVRVCDPACGSGAYLLGMLHELLDLRAALFAVKQIDHQKIYDRKLAIIQQNIYGVDIDPFAVNIARLRLWLSLMIEFEGNDPPILPNLDYKIETGDSLAAPSPSSVTIDMFRQSYLSEYITLKNQYIRYSGDKKSLRQRIDEVKHEIEKWDDRTRKHKGFDWFVEFTEVFVEGGFDIVVANPPYINQRLINEIYKEEVLSYIYKDIYHGNADIYTYFFMRANQIIKNETGFACFISSSLWLKASYGEKIRKNFLGKHKVIDIIDFGELPLFDSASTFPAIFVWNKQKRVDNSTRYVSIDNLDDCYRIGISEYIKGNNFLIPAENFSDGLPLVFSPEKFLIINKMRDNNQKLRDVINEGLYRGVTTGFNEAFIIDLDRYKHFIEMNEEYKKIIKPVLSGDDIRRYEVNYRDKYIIFTKRGIDISLYPELQDYLMNFYDDLIPKKDKNETQGRKKGLYKWYEIQDSTEYFNIFDSVKIISSKMALEPRFVLDFDGYYLLNTTYCINSSEWYLLGILNSKPIENYIKATIVAFGNPDKKGRTEPRVEDLLNIPIPNISEEDKSNIGRVAKFLQEMYFLRRLKNEEIMDKLNIMRGKSNSRNSIEQAWNMSYSDILRRYSHIDKIEYDKFIDEISDINNNIQIMETEMNKNIFSIYGLKWNETLNIESL